MFTYCYMVQFNPAYLLSFSQAHHIWCGGLQGSSQRARNR